MLNTKTTVDIYLTPNIPDNIPSSLATDYDQFHMNHFSIYLTCIFKLPYVISKVISWFYSSNPRKSG